MINAPSKRPCSVQAEWHRWLTRLRAGATAAAVFATCLAAPAIAAGDDAAALAELRQQVERMKADYERRIETLEQRIELLEQTKAGRGDLSCTHPSASAAGRNPEAGRPGAPTAAFEAAHTTSRPPTPATSTRTGDRPAATSGELEALRAAARAAAGSSNQPASSTGAPPTTDQATRHGQVGHERNLNRLNPEISFTGDIVARAHGPIKTFDAREFELDMQAALDPFSSTKWTVSFSPEGVDVEEGYIKYTGLGRGLTLRAGKMRQSFGSLNRYHQHALPQTDYPLVIQRVFGEEGLAQTGVSAEWLVPRPWASANEIIVQLTDGEAEPFGGGSFERLSVLGRIKNYWDVSPSTYAEWGLSAIAGQEDVRRDTRIWGMDFTLHWQPPERAKYRELTWRSEAILSQRDNVNDRRQDAWGAYTYAEGLIARNLYAGLEYDWAEDPLNPSDEQWRLSPFITWWQSEYVRLRGMYQFVRDQGTRDRDHRIMLQLTWAAGPHKHESY